MPKFQKHFRIIYIYIHIYISWNSRVIFIYAFLFFIAVLRKLLLYSRPWVCISQFHSSFSTCWNTCVIFNYKFLFFTFINYTSSDVVGFCDFSNTSAPFSNFPSIFGFFPFFSFLTTLDTTCVRSDFTIRKIRINVCNIHSASY